MRPDPARPGALAPSLCSSTSLTGPPPETSPRGWSFLFSLGKILSESSTSSNAGKLGVLLPAPPTPPHPSSPRRRPRLTTLAVPWSHSWSANQPKRLCRQAPHYRPRCPPCTQRRAHRPRRNAPDPRARRRPRPLDHYRREVGPALEPAERQGVRFQDPTTARPPISAPASTVHGVLARHDLCRLAWLDRPTAALIRRPGRYQGARSGELAHVDVKRPGRLRDGGWPFTAATAWPPVKPATGPGSAWTTPTPTNHRHPRPR